MGVNRCIFVFLGVNNSYTFTVAKRVIEDNIICKRDQVKGIELTKYDFINEDRYLPMMLEGAKKKKNK